MISKIGGSFPTWKKPTVKPTETKTTPSNQRSFGIYNNPLAERPAVKDSLRIMSYNILSGQNYDAIKREIQKSNADVIGLQEAPREVAERLAKDLGMNLASYDSPGVAGKAILSRYPIKSGSHITYPTTLGQKADHLWGSLTKKYRPEVNEQRGMLQSTIQVGARKIAILDTHLTLSSSSDNAKQLQILKEQGEKLEKEGYSVIMMGDFNTNLGTTEDYQKRYGKGLGNAGDAKDNLAIESLLKEFPSYWQGEKRELIDKKGKTITPEAAQEELKSATKGTVRYRELQDLADGNSHTAADKRFDNILTKLKVEKAQIDFSAKGSDHQPVWADIKL